MVTAPLKFIYWTAIDHPSPSHDSSEESVTPKGNLTPRKNPPNMVTNVGYYPYLDPSLSDSSDLSDDKYYK